MKIVNGRLAVVLMLVIAMLMTGLTTGAFVPTADAATIQLSGRIEDQHGNLVPGSVLTFHDAVNDIVIMTIDAVDGTYGAPIDDGIYDVVVEPPAGLSLGSLREDLVVLFADQSRDFVVPTIIDTWTIDGAVTTNGVGIPDVEVGLDGRRVSTDAGGSFSVDVPVGYVGIGIQHPQTPTTPAFFLNGWLDATSDQTINLDLPSIQMISVSIVDDATGLPLDGEVYAYLTVPPFTSLATNIWAEGWAEFVTTTTAGAASVAVFTTSPVHFTVILDDGTGHDMQWNGQSTQEIRVIPQTSSTTSIIVDGTLTAGGVPLPGVETFHTRAATDPNGGFSISTEPTDHFALGFNHWDKSIPGVPDFDLNLGIEPLPSSITVDIDLPALTTLDVSIIDAGSGQPINAYARVNGSLPITVTGPTPTHVSGSWHDDDQIASSTHSFAAFNDPNDVVFDIEFEGEWFQIPWDGQNPTTLSITTSTKAVLSTTVTAGGVPVTAVILNGRQLNSPTGDYAVSQPPNELATFDLFIDGHDLALNLPTVAISGMVDLRTDVHVPVQLPAISTYTVRLVDADTGLAVDGHVAASGLMAVAGLDDVELFYGPVSWSSTSDTFVGETTLRTFHDGSSPITLYVTGAGPTEFFTWSGDSDTVTLPVELGYSVPEVPFTTGTPGQSVAPIVGESLPFTIQTCPNGTGAWTVSLFGSVIDSGPLSELPAGSGEYHGTVPPILTPGIYSLESVIDCDNDGTADVTSTQPLDYLDPSGQVFDCQGNPLENVEVTLWRADNGTDPLVMVPDGSDIMSPANRANPSYTTATGYYRWDTIPGWYQVQATIPGVGTVSSDRLVVPPERFGVDLTFDTVNCVGDPVITTTPPTTTDPNPSRTPTPTRTFVPAQISAPRPDPVVGEIIGGTLNCHTRPGVYDGEDVMMLVVDVPPILAVWFDPDAKVRISGGSARFNDAMPLNGSVETPIQRTSGDVNVTLRTTLITGASYSVSCPEPVTIAPLVSASGSPDAPETP